MQLEPWTHGDGTEENPQLWCYLREAYGNISQAIAKFLASKDNPPEEWLSSPGGTRGFVQQITANALATVSQASTVARSYRRYDLQEHPECLEPLETLEEAINKTREYLQSFSSELSRPPSAKNMGSAAVHVVGKLSPDARVTG